MQGDLILTTGVLRRNSNTVAAHVEVANFSQSKVRDVTIQFYNWDTTPPTLIASFPINLPPSSNTPLDISVTSDHYEVRAIFDDKYYKDDVTVNSYGRDANFVFQEGNTVLFEELVQLQPKHHHNNP
jgi:hypothetical protein